MKRTHIGGQAVMEGVMMRGKKSYTVAVRTPEGKIETSSKELSSITHKWKSFRLPILRGIIAFVESLKLGITTLNYSASFYEEEEEPNKFELWLQKKLGNRFNDFLLQVSMILGIGLGVGLFILFPNIVTAMIFNPKTQAVSYNMAESLLRVFIFLAYLLGISKIKEIHRVFQYHGAEHKVISCYEHGEELTVDNVKKHSRLHPRCGTSFLFLVMVISIIVFSFIRVEQIWFQILARVILIPLVAGLAYEFIKLAGTYENTVLSALSYPGMALQNITTQEPDETQIEVAISAMKGVISNEQNL